MRKLWIVLTIFVIGLAAAQAILNAQVDVSKAEGNTGAVFSKRAPWPPEASAW